MSDLAAGGARKNMQVPIEIFLIGHTRADRNEMRRWLDFKGVKEFAFPPEDAVTDPSLLIGMAAKRCYMSYDTTCNPNIQKVRTDWAEYLDNVLKASHGSVLEHATYSFAIENVSRVFTAEMNRHRAGWAISEGSLRYIRFAEAIPYWEPDFIKGPDVYTAAAVEKELRFLQEEGYPAYSDFSVEKKKQLTRELFARHFENTRQWYALLERIWAEELAPNSTFKWKKTLTSLFRRGVGMGCATGGVWTGNIRAIRHVMTMRCDPGAEEEILHVFSRIVLKMREVEPMLVGDFHQDENGYWRPKYLKV